MPKYEPMTSNFNDANSVDDIINKYNFDDSTEYAYAKTSKKDFLRAYFLNSRARQAFFEEEIVIRQKHSLQDAMEKGYDAVKKEVYEKNLGKLDDLSIFSNWQLKANDKRIQSWKSITLDEKYQFFIKQSNDQELGGGNLAYINTVNPFILKFKLKAAGSIGKLIDAIKKQINPDNEDKFPSEVDANFGIDFNASIAKSINGYGNLCLWTSLPIYDSQNHRTDDVMPIYLNLSGFCYSYEHTVGFTLGGNASYKPGRAQVDSFDENGKQIFDKDGKPIKEDSKKIADILASNWSGTATLNLVDLIRQIAKEQDTYVGILADLQGPKIRLSKFKNGSVIIKKGQKFTLDADLGIEDGDENTVGIDYKELIQDVKKGDILLVDDGKIVLEVDSVKGNKAVTKVVIGGKVSNNKGINKKGGGLTAPALTDKDKQDIKVAAMLQVDFLAVSFVRDGKDMEYARQLVNEAGWKPAMVAKIERAEAVLEDNLKSIVDASDLVMVARGDLAVEIGDENVPTVQKLIISTARRNEKGSITATQMMESMIENSSPTRAEASDVANAVFDGTDAVMLSAETAVGKYPVETISAMSRICESAERSKYTHITKKQKIADCDRVDHAVSVAAVKIANDIGAKGLIVLTEGGNTSRWMSRVNSELPIYALSRNATTLGAMTLFRGVVPLYFDSTRMSKLYVNRSASMELESRGLAKDGDILVLTSGDSMGVHGSTNKIKVIIAGQVR